MTEKTVSDSLLDAFDSVLAAGDTLPLEELKKRYLDSKHFAGSYRQSLIFLDVAELPVTVAMVRGNGSDAVSQVLDGLKALYGEELMYEFSGRGDSVTLAVRVWRPESELRKAWRGFAEEEYKSENLDGAS
jgi:hypothetical protein